MERVLLSRHLIELAFGDGLPYPEHVKLIAIRSLEEQPAHIRDGQLRRVGVGQGSH